ncbi:MAG: CocE/NonD family hydrolase [Leptolyngbyaceae cyanobacterium CAN_BIN12]|nr:CocE/NonD family hydrolase [Leptolyngbyaceae cyanobacterium CAN_BIN12]
MTFPVTKETVSMWTRDRVRLDADVYRPTMDGEFPILLMRQPYGRAIASTVVYAHPTCYAAQGYIVVIQYVRGRGTSEGEFKLFAHEIEDGYDSVQWAANLTGSIGAVGMYGFSYQGMTQLYAAAAKPIALKTICPAMLAYDLYSDWAYENGAFCLQANLGWALQLSAETARLKGDEDTFCALTMAAKTLTFNETIPTRSRLLSELDPTSFYHEWLTHPEPGAYWEALSPKTYLQNVDLPMLHIGGWFDTFLRGTLSLYKEMASRSQHRQQLIVGAWGHLPWGRRVGAIDFGTEANNPCDRLQIRWFDHFLKGNDTGLLHQPPIQLFEMGTNQWRFFDFWNCATPLPLYLSSTGLAGMDDQDGKLIQSPQLLRRRYANAPCHSSDVFIHDPWRPVPAQGGHAAFPSGSFERSALDCRTDILTYTSEPLTEALHLIGEVILKVCCAADTPSFDLCAVLSTVSANGKVYNFAQGYIHVQPTQKTDPLTFALQPTCICIQPGQAIRLSLSGACFPAYPVNAGTDESAGETRLIDQQIVTITIMSGGINADSAEHHLSYILLPIA